MEDILVIDHIKRLCEVRGWTYYRLSKESGISHATISVMLNNQHIPKLSTLIKICEGFGIPMSEFFLGVENKLDDSGNYTSEFLRLWYLVDTQDKQKVLSYLYGLAHEDIPITLEN